MAMGSRHADISSALNGLTVAVTRPIHQAETLCRMLEAQGATVLRFPVIDIQPPTNTAFLQTQLKALDEAQMAIFISANAVRHTYQALDNKRLPENLTRLAVGQATARALAAQGQPAQIQPRPPYNSEALLALPELQSIKGVKVIVLRGSEGRTLLVDTLSARGAELTQAEVYRRVAGRSDPKQLYQAWDTGNLDVIVVTSNEGLRNLYAQVNAGYREQLLNTRLVVISERSAKLARSLGFIPAPVVANAASDEALFEAVKNTQQEQK